MYSKSNVSKAVLLALLLLAIPLLMYIQTSIYVSENIGEEKDIQRIYRNLDCMSNSLKQYIADNKEIPVNSFGEVSLFPLLSLRDHSKSISIDCFACRDGAFDLKYAISKRVCLEHLEYVMGGDDRDVTANPEEDILIVYYGDYVKEAPTDKKIFVVCKQLNGENFIKEFPNKKDRSSWVSAYVNQQY